MKTEMVDVDDLKFAEYNPRTISTHDFDSLKRSIQEFGLVEPIIVNRYQGRENIIVGGHQRAKAAKAVGMGSVPVFYVSLPVPKEKALNLALNRIGGQFQYDQLPPLLEELDKTGDLELSGFGEKEIDRMLYSGSYDLEGISEDEFSPDEIKKWGGAPVTRPGEIIQLGPHTLGCGDARDAEFMEKVVPTAADLIFTDPPYNVAYQGGRLGTILNDAQKPEEFQQFITDAFRAAFRVSKPGAVFYICMGFSSYPVLMDALKPLDAHLANVIVWVKDTAPLGWQDYKYKHELVVKGNTRGKKEKADVLAYGWKKGEHYFAPIRDEADVWHVSKRNSREYVHPTQKPLSLIARALSNSSRKGDLVLDPFGGSGSTLIAAEASGRRCAIAELDPKYCDIIRTRYARFVKDPSLAV